MSSSWPPGRVAVVGLGVMGGSLARGLSTLVDPPEITGYDIDPEAGRLAREAGAVDRVARTPEEAIENADLVVLATPLSAVTDLLEAHGGALAGTVVTDVASLKVPVVEAARRAGLEDVVVPGHPMAGSERSGFAAARTDLYRDAPVHLCRDLGEETARRTVEALWHALSARPSWTSAREHDRRMVRASHLPQLVSNALALTLEAAGIEPSELGPGGRDATRLAGSSSGMWRDLLAVSAPELAVELRAVSRHLEALADALESGTLDRVHDAMERSRGWLEGGEA